MKFSHSGWKICLALCVGWILSAPVVLACVGCREPGSQTLDHENPTVMAGEAFSWSVLFMLVFAISLVVAMSAYIWRTCVRLDQQQIS